MASAARLTLEELAAAAEMTPRNVRAYRTKGLLQPGVRQGRRSLYGPEHVERLRAVRQAREQGVSLVLIRAILRRGGGDGLEDELATLLGLAAAPGFRSAAGDGDPDDPDGDTDGDPDGDAYDPARHRLGAAPHDHGGDHGGDHRGPSRLVTLLAERSAARDAATLGDVALLRQVAQLVEVGVLTREGDDVLAPTALAGSVRRLEQEGVSVPQTLGVLACAVDAAAPVVAMARQVLPPDLVPRVAGALADLAGGTLAQAVSSRLSPEPPR